MDRDPFVLPDSRETGTIPIYHLKRFWAREDAKKHRDLSSDAFTHEWPLDQALLSALGLGLEQTMTQLYTASDSFEAFESWVLERNHGAVPVENIERFNTLVASLETSNATPETPGENVLTDADLTHWDEHGYVVVRDAVSKEDCAAAAAAVWEYLQMDRDDASTWYRAHDGKQGIMVQLFQNAALEKNRQSERIRRAYEQLWGRSDLWVSTDRAGFNPPETPTWRFPGPRLHWDVSLKQPIPFGTQGILYLTDTLPEQGALTLVPGFHRRVGNWLAELPDSVKPREADLYSLGAVAIGGHAGDFIIWHQALPHGSSANRTTKPRIVQYINWQPAEPQTEVEWL